MNIIETLQDGLRKGFKTSFYLAKILLPFYFLMELLKGSALLSYISKAFSPLMKYFGLPGEAALAFVAGSAINLYAALAIMIPLNLDWKQISIMGLMLGIAHNILVEGAILKEMGTKYMFLTLARFVLAVFAGITVYRIMQVF